MILRALERGYARWAPVINAQGEKEYVVKKVLPGTQFEYRDYVPGESKKLPLWCEPIDDEAKAAYEDIYGTSNPEEFPSSRTWKLGSPTAPHPSLANKPIDGSVRKGAGTGIAGFSNADTGVPVMPSPSAE